MCHKCDGFSETIRIEHPYEYFDLVDQIRVIINEGTMHLTNGNCNFDEIAKGKPFPDDIIYHEFKCTNCGRNFSLCVETYHGSGGSWEVINNIQERDVNKQRFNES